MQSLVILGLLGEPGRGVGMATLTGPRLELTRECGVFRQYADGSLQRPIAEGAMLDPQLGGRERVADATLEFEVAVRIPAPQRATAVRAHEARRVALGVVIVGHQDSGAQKCT